MVLFDCFYPQIYENYLKCWLNSVKILLINVTLITITLQGILLATYYHKFVLIEANNEGAGDAKQAGNN